MRVNEENTSNTDYLLDYDSKTIKYDFDDYDHNADDYEPGDTLDEGFYKWGSKYSNYLT